MRDSRGRPRWVDLAIRSRQWALDEQVPVLQQATAEEDAARLKRERVDEAVAKAGDARDCLLARERFDVTALMSQSAFEHALRGRAQAAMREEAEASSAAQDIREEMQRSLAARDALDSHAEQLLKLRHREQERVAAREMDELWMLQRALPSEG